MEVTQGSCKGEVSKLCISTCSCNSGVLFSLRLHTNIKLLNYKVYNLCLSILASILYVTVYKFILRCLNGYSIPKSESCIYLYEPGSCSLYMYIFAVNQLWKSCWWRRDRERGREREREEEGREGDTSLVSSLMRCSLPAL